MSIKHDIYLISDSTGETIDRIFLALKAQFLNFEYNNFIPTAYANLFWITRHQSHSDYYYNNKGLILDNIDLNYDVTFLLFSIK